MKGPRITLRCDCGKEEARVAYGERWRCPACGRTYDTSSIPEDEYRALEQAHRHYRIVGWGVGAVLAILVLVLILQDKPLFLLVALPALLLIWFTYGRPILRSRYRRAIAGTKSWELRAEGGPED
jgi:hypothetical protein